MIYTALKIIIAAAAILAFIYGWGEVIDWLDRGTD